MRFRVLGSVQAWVDGWSLPLGGPRQVSLLAFLLVNANRPVSSDALIDAVWGSERSGADKRLQMAIARLRKALEPQNDADGSALRTVGGGYQLSVEAGELDAEVFAAGVSEGRRALEAGEFQRAAGLLGEALGLWRGPALAEVAFEDFAQAEIRRLQELRWAALEARVDSELALGRHAELVGELEGLLAQQPARERVAGQLMLALYRCGRQADALEVYRRHRAHLAEELGLEPAPELRALQVQILEQAPSLEVSSPAQTSVTVPPGTAARSAPEADVNRRSNAQGGATSTTTDTYRLPWPADAGRVDGRSLELIGRGEEQGLIAAMLADVQSGVGRALLVSGEPGVGKSALLEFAMAVAEGFRILRTVGVESESDLAFSGLVDLLWPVSAHLGELPDRQRGALETALGVGSGEADRFGVSVATLGLLAAVAEAQPVLCVVDDAQWVDPASRDAVLFAARRLRDDRVGFMLAARGSEEVGFEVRGIERLVVDGLDREAGRRLLASTAREPLAPVVVNQLVEQTGGNPLALVELPGALRPAQRSGREPLEEPLVASAAVERAFGVRIADLSDAARRVLAVAALSDTDRLAVVLDAAGADSPGLDEAEVAGLVRIDGDRLFFRHPLVRSAVASGLTARQRRQVHADLAEVLAATDPDRAVWHRAAACVGPDDSVADDLARVAAQVGRRGGAEAEGRLFERAAGLSTDPDARAERYGAAGRAAYHAGRGSYAAALFDIALGSTEDSALRAELLQGRTEVALVCGEITEWVEACREAAARIRSADPAAAVRLLLPVFDYAAGQHDVRAGRELLDRMLDWTPDAATDVSCQWAIAWQSMVEGDRAAARAASDRGVWLSQDTGSEKHTEFGFVYVMIGEFAAARALLEPLVARFRRESALFDLAVALQALACLEARVGRLAAAEDAVGEAVSLQEENGYVFWVCNALADLTVIHALSGRHDEAASAARRILESADRVGIPGMTAFAHFALGVLAINDGRPADAAAAFELCRDAFAECTPYFVTWEAELIDAYRALGRFDDAREVLEHFKRRSVGADEITRVILSRSCALLEPDQTAWPAFQRALAQAAPWLLEHARAELAFGERLRRSGRRNEARRHLRSAYETFQRIGAYGFARRAETELAKLGERIDEHALTGPAILTERERQIARLAADGATNQEIAARVFLSPKTIEKHLSSAYIKLGVRSRTQLARLVGDW
jgi:DNA-binding SARP family transcriptional activator/DNA-binding CsgD family transcriptional regulator